MGIAMQEVAQIAGFILLGAMILVGSIGLLITILTRNFEWRIVWGFVSVIPAVLLVLGSALIDKQEDWQVFILLFVVLILAVGVTANTLIAIRQLRKEAVDTALRLGRDGGGW
jgi:hypothetical protein